MTPPKSVSLFFISALHYAPGKIAGQQCFEGFGAGLGLGVVRKSDQHLTRFNFGFKWLTDTGRTGHARRGRTAALGRCARASNAARKPARASPACRRRSAAKNAAACPAAPPGALRDLICSARQRSSNNRAWEARAGRLGPPTAAISASGAYLGGGILPPAAASRQGSRETAASPLFVSVVAFSSLALLQANTRPSAILVDELYSRRLEGLLNC